MPSILCIRLHACLGLACWLLAALVPVAARADLVSEYFSGLESIEADFVQTVVDSAGEQVQDSKGRVWIERPGRFRWDYQTPYRQLIVADGKQLWTYDEDLEQATVKDLDAALSSTPAMLLSGYRPLSDVMVWEPDTDKDNDQYSWFRLHPKEKDSAVEKVRIGFDGKQLAIIEVVDGFGNHTRIQFSNMRRNQKLDSGLFHLRLPEGTDIIGAKP
jgi:outer membrane lipoprotein carrier protein